ncbi:MAG: hypothetical protein OES59_00995 [Gammaproteobacteria bacterium]|jgi:hypothetical protein|nr:hypothetical protein [Gammaproteobacteria bacterium]MDH3777368.1 hypothetical protein [Gammaproteobacteria bacterium]MDH3812437.1 hypothetical protein [Gammaproteobacteria bacterium]MDH3860572.1 hypothetical protein [Gammaproteobacteria bacterium]
MIENNGDKEDIDFDESDETSDDESLDVDTSSSDDDRIPDIGGDTMVDISAELNVEELVAKLESIDPNEVAHRREVRRRLEELREQRDADLDSTFNFSLDDDL